MKKVCILLFLFFFTFSLSAQTLDESGDWGVASNWSTGVVPNQISIDVGFKQNINGTIRNGSTFSVGNVALTNQNDLIIDFGGGLNVGSSTQNKNFTTDNNAYLQVDGDLYIYGDLVVNNNLTLVVTGTMYVLGNVILKNGGSLDVSGELTVGGDFTGGENTSLNVDGTVKIGGDLSVGQNSTLTGTGTINLSGSCTDDNKGTFCGIGPLPVTLLYFKAAAQNQSVAINWASLKAWDFSHYELERSENGKEFYQIATIDAAENSNETIKYSFVDNNPVFGTAYYRLKAVDIDGKFEYKGIEMVKFGTESFKVYPNPSNLGYVAIDWSHAAQGAVASLKDNTGRTVRRATLSGQVSKIDTSNLTAGMYLLVVQGAAGVQKTQLMIK